MKKILAFTLAVMMVLSTASFASPIMTSTVINASEIYEELPNYTAQPDQGELKADDLGTLIARVDFEDVEEGKTLYTKVDNVDQLQPLTDWGNVYLPKGFPELYLRITGGTLTAENDGSNGYAAWTLSGNGWAKLGIYTSDAEKKLLPPGQYTLKADLAWQHFKLKGEDKDFPNMSSVWTPNDKNGNWTTGETNLITTPFASASSLSGYTTYTTVMPCYEGQMVLPQDHKEKFALKGLGKGVFYFNASGDSFDDALMHIDNIELYYKAPDTTVTLDYGNPDIENPVFKVVAGKTVIDLTDYVAESDSTKAFTGWKLEGTTNALKSYTPAEPASAVTLVPAYNYYAPGLGLEGDEYDNYSDINANIWNNSGEKPSSSNPEFTYDVDKANGTVKINAKFKSDTTLPVITDFNTHLTPQINANKALRTDAIKGLEYRYRVLAPDGAENASTYFTANSQLETKIYFKVNCPEDSEITSCGSSVGWHWGECVGFPKAVVAKGKEYNGEWITVTYDLNSLTKNAHNDASFTPWLDADSCIDFRIKFLSTTTVAGDFSVEVDYVRFILADGMASVTPQYVSSNFYDLRKGYFDITFADEIEGISADEVYNIVDSGNFCASELISTDGGNATYRIYACSSLTDKTVSFKDYAYTSTGIIIATPELKAVTHTYTLDEVASKNDGENLFPNGDFSNPYYNVFTDESIQKLALGDGKLTVTLTEKAREWSTLSAPAAIKLKPNTHYYVDIDASFTKDAVANEPHKTNTDVVEKAALYFPVLDGTMNFSENRPTTSSRVGPYDYIPSTMESDDHFLFSGSTLGSGTQSITKVIDIKDEAYYADTSNIQFTTGACSWDAWKSTFFDKASVYIQPCFSNGKNAGLFTPSDDGSIALLKGLEYQVEKIVIKEMFPITFKDEETVLGTYYAAKDVPIVLPKSTLYVSNSGEAIIGWSDGTKIYAPQELYTLTQASAKELTAVTQNIPITSDKISMRADKYTGVRFRASVSCKMKENEKTNEFGYIVTRKDLLDAAGIDEADFTAESNVKQLSGQAYVKGSVDKVFENNGSFNYFTAVLYNIPSTQYDDVLVARPYLIHNGVTTYGAPVASSLRSAANAIKGTSAYDELPDEAKSVVDSITG